MNKYDEIYERVKNTLSEKRFYHSECVVERAIEYAKIYGENEEKAKVAGILHDIAKEVPKEEKISTAEKYGIELNEEERKSPGILHGKIAAKIAEIEYDLDEDICNSISYHTTGRPNMTKLEKIIYLADYTGKDRKYEDTNYIYELSKKDLDEAMLYCLKKTINSIVGEDKILHLDTVRAYNFYLNKD
jgi:nicotinate-nucleotide adenylyltransferase